MSTREVLVERADVANRDIDDIIEIAAELQDVEREAAEGASVDDVRAVAEELDIAPEYVDAAIAKLKTRRAHDTEQAAQSEREATEQSARLRKLALGAAAATLGAAVLIAAMVGGLAVSADSTLDAALDNRERASTNLTVVLDRQASLAPQLVALAGGPSAALTRLASDLRDADGVTTKLKASDALGAAMATQLGQLPPPAGPAAAQSRADLQHEVSGITNRITVERRRYEEARLTYDQANRGLGASLARGIGLH